MNHRTKVLIAFALVYVIWGSTYLAIRVGAPYMASALFGAARFLSAGLLLLIGLRALGRSIRVSRSDLGALAVAGFLLLVTGNGLVILAEKTVPSGLAALVVAAVPLWIAAMEAVLPGGERISRRGLAGIGLGLVGLAVLSWPQLTHNPGQEAEPFGILVLLAASLSWAAGTLFVRRRRMALDPFVATGWEMVLGGLLSLLIGLVLQGREPIVWNSQLLGALAYLAVFGSVVGFSAYVWLVKNVPAAKVATHAYVNPVIAVLLGWWLLRETIDLYVLGGMAVILLAVVLVNSARVGGSPPGRPIRGPARIALRAAPDAVE